MKMQNVLRQIMARGEMVAIYGDAFDYDYDFVGYIQAMDENGLLLSKENHGGYPNGFVLLPT